MSREVTEESVSKLAVFEQDMDRPWQKMDLNAYFFDCISMHNLRELLAISEICRSFCPERIVEYGTAMGGLTRLLGRWAYITDAKVLSIENGCYSSYKGLPKHTELIKHLPVELLFANEYDQSTYEKVQEFAADHRTFFYCDGGNKPQELKWCAAILKKGDLLACHDYHPNGPPKLSIELPPILGEISHVTKEQVDKLMEKENLEFVFDDYLGGIDPETKERWSRVLVLRRKEN